MGDVNKVIDIFNTEFKNTYNTILVSGGEEPIYLPSGSKNEYNQIIFREYIISSALHEIAHWCLAGKERRKQKDYGYWYNPDNRSINEQILFYNVEVKPQALEWAFSKMINIPFNISLDCFGNDLELIKKETENFKKAVNRQLKEYQKNLPLRARIFAQKLKSYA